ncbi:sigma-70 family RNA polymerase sigma factor [Bacillus timonensis]|uniref:Sigma-70 family RNA polymerase sigma factor n=1 Tax=Bacillus timonensis TaxID=1033734 RepID=A0A4S3PJB4_9BACI|nr:sigma-70 family RNA polymerase sigma factor [Bacillus timonensis]THE09510.1 sigma-70 family RNA polymerase sigma factor [Bacillus timonensis]
MNIQTEEQESNKRELLKYLMDEYGDSVKRLAYSYVKNWDTSEDIAQDVFLICYSKLDDFRGDSSYKTWIYRITINKCKDVLKNKWFAKTEFFGFISYFKSTFSVEEEVLKKSAEIELAESVYSLPLKYREVIILYYYEQLKIREIHDLTGLNSETIKSRLKRAKSLLQLKYREVE